MNLYQYENFHSKIMKNTERGNKIMKSIKRKIFAKKSLNKEIFINGQSEFEKSKKYFKEKEIIKNYGDNFIKEIKHISIYKTTLSHLNLKECKISHSKITQSNICDNSYLRHAKFECVDFTGTIFENVNLEKATFKNCRLNYVRFENCIIDYKSILKSKPDEPNLYMLLLKSLYKNELQQGHLKEADELRILYKKEERKLYLRFLGLRKDTNPSYFNKDYYKQEMKRKNLSKRKILYRLTASYVDWLIWGHGIKIKNILFSMIFFIFIFAILYICTIGQNFYTSMLISAKCWFLNNDYDGNSFTKYIMLLENLFGLISLALFTSAFYRKVER